MRSRAATAVLPEAPTARKPRPAQTATGPVRLAALLSACALLLVLLFAHRFVELAAVWYDDPNYSHGFLVPLVSGYFAWQAWRHAGWPRGGDLALGVAWLAVGGLLHLAAVVVWLPPVDFLALASLLYGLALLAGGRGWARGFAFSIGFLFFCFPLPAALTGAAALELQDVVTSLGTGVLQLFLPAWREGNFIHLPGQQLEVGEACSGLRQVVAFVATALVIGHLGRRPWPFRMALVVAALPVAVTANLLRVLCMALVMRTLGVGWIGGVYHDLWGMMTLAVGVGLLGVAAWWLGRVLTNESLSREPPARAVAGITDPGYSIRQGSRLNGALLCLALTWLAQLALVIHLEAAASETVDMALSQPLAALPHTLGPWTARAGPPVAENYTQQADDHLNRVYTWPAAGLACHVFAIQFRDGRDRVHHPLVCHDVAGFAEDSSSRAALPLDGSGGAAIRFCFVRNGQRHYVHYWHYTLVSPPPEGATLLQRIYLRRARSFPSVTVEVSDAAVTDEQHAAVAALVRAVDAELRKQLPSGASAGSDVLPVRLTGGPRHQ